MYISSIRTWRLLCNVAWSTPAFYMDWVKKDLMPQKWTAKAALKMPPPQNQSLLSTHANKLLNWGSSKLQRSFSSSAGPWLLSCLLIDLHQCNFKKTNQSLFPFFTVRYNPFFFPLVSLLCTFFSSNSLWKKTRKKIIQCRISSLCF